MIACKKRNITPIGNNTDTTIMCVMTGSLDEYGMGEMGVISLARSDDDDLR